MYKWHRGFRRDINGRYIKVSVKLQLSTLFFYSKDPAVISIFMIFTQVTVLKLQIKYEDAGGLVPWELHIYFISEEGEESDNYKVRCKQKHKQDKAF